MYYYYFLNTLLIYKIKVPPYRHLHACAVSCHCGSTSRSRSRFSNVVHEKQREYLPELYRIKMNKNPFHSHKRTETDSPKHKSRNPSRVTGDMFPPQSSIKNTTIYLNVFKKKREIRLRLQQLALRRSVCFFLWSKVFSLKKCWWSQQKYHSTVNVCHQKIKPTNKLKTCRIFLEHSTDSYMFLFLILSV